MKTTTYIIQFFLIAVIGITVGCEKEIKAIDANETSRSNTEFLGKWNLDHVFGGFAGANEQYATGEVIWAFNNNNVIVENNGTNSSYFSLPTGTYQYNVIYANGNTYLSIDQSELGRYIITGDTMNIDENQRSTGDLACGFFMKLQR